MRHFQLNCDFCGSGRSVVIHQSTICGLISGNLNTHLRVLKPHIDPAVFINVPLVEIYGLNVWNEKDLYESVRYSKLNQLKMFSLGFLTLFQCISLKKKSFPLFRSELTIFLKLTSDTTVFLNVVGNHWKGTNPDKNRALISVPFKSNVIVAYKLYPWVQRDKMSLKSEAVRK